MTDRLLIADLEVSCRLGVFDWEQAHPQPVWIDLELGIDAAKAAVQDDVKQAIDYARLVSLVKTLAELQPFRLMETLAEMTAEAIRREFKVAYLKVRVKKRALPGIGYAAVEIERR